MNLIILEIASKPKLCCIKNEIKDSSIPMKHSHNNGLIFLNEIFSPLLINKNTHDIPSDNSARVTPGIPETYCRNMGDKSIINV